MCTALDRFLIRGVSSNLSFLSALMEHPRFKDGNISTNMIGEEYPDGFHPSDSPHDDPATIIAVAAFMLRSYRDRAARISGQLAGHERHVPRRLGGRDQRRTPSDLPSCPWRAATM